jgi:hypothetical protein
MEENRGDFSVEAGSENRYRSGGKDKMMSIHPQLVAASHDLEDKSGVAGGAMGPSLVHKTEH